VQELVQSSEMPPTLIGQRDMQCLCDVAAQAPAGCFVEVGVYHGGSAYWLEKLAQAQGRPIFLYDTFTGIPCKDEWDSHSVGDFSDVDEQDVRSRLVYATITKGIFPDCAIEMPPVAFAHLDCDQYRSVKESALYLQARMVKGGVIWFDDSPCLLGAHRAARELFGDRLALSHEHGKHYVII
jgi:hypothetical protein